MCQHTRKIYKTWDISTYRRGRSMLLAEVKLADKIILPPVSGTCNAKESEPSWVPRCSYFIQWDMQPF